MASEKRVGRTFLSDAFLNLRGDTTEVKIPTLRKPRRVWHPHVPVEACMAAPMLRFYPHLSAKKMRLEKYREAWHLMKPGPPRVVGHSCPTRLHRVKRKVPFGKAQGRLSTSQDDRCAFILLRSG